MTDDPLSFADGWSFDGRFYAWMAFFHGLAFFSGKDVRPQEAFQGDNFHADLFGPNGALYSGLEHLGTAEAEARLSFSEKVMDRLRRNEVRYLLDTANTMQSFGLLLACLTIVGTIAVITYGLGTGQEEVALCSFPCFFVPFIVAVIGKKLVQRRWHAERMTMGAFVTALPWLTISTSKSL